VANSGGGLQSQVGGWQIVGLRVGNVTAAYETTFGDPAASSARSRFSPLRAVSASERSDYAGFLKLTAALYAGILIGMADA
jgi:hypothetical protein